ncbi:hypothetical protein [Pseudactinotalea sp.]|uniref:hypothetical protein n=1 Tax=Pseudactinotalea sp. TaxID=1926260 RepID=UPI003B3B17A1
METFISATSALTAVVGIAIALLTYTSDARLHRRIARLHAAHTMMAAAPSPVIHRALRGSLAELQAREALRPQIRTYRFGAISFTVLLAGLTAESVWFSTARAMNLDMKVPLTYTVVFVAITGVFACATVLVLTLNQILSNRKDGLAKAFYAGEVPDEENLGDFVSNPTVHVSWRRPAARAVLTVLGVITGGTGVGLVVTAPQTDLWPALVITGTWLALSGACIAAISTIAIGRTGTALGHSHPTRGDFLARD